MNVDIPDIDDVEEQMRKSASDAALKAFQASKTATPVPIPPQLPPSVTSPEPIFVPAQLAGSTSAFVQQFGVHARPLSPIMPAPVTSIPVIAPPVLESAQPIKKIFSSSAVLVNPRQKGNPLLQYIRHAPLEYAEILPDFVVGQTSCILFLSLRYHALHPTYLFDRLKELGKNYKLRILLTLVDMEDSSASLQQLGKVSLTANFTLVLAWSNAEAARLVETYKIYEKKSADTIMERPSEGFLDRAMDVLTMIRSVNKTDVVNLVSHFKTLKKLSAGSMHELSNLPGIGEKKVRHIYDTFNASFSGQVKKPKLSLAPYMVTDSDQTASVTTTTSTTTTIVDNEEPSTSTGEV